MEEQKINVCRALATLFGEDPTDEETAFVGRCALDLGLDDSAMKLVLEALGAPIDRKQVIETIQDPLLRRFFFRRLVAAVLVDEQLNEREQEVIDEVAGIFGWDKSIVNQYVAHMQEFIAMEKKGEELIAQLG